MEICNKPILDFIAKPFGQLKEQNQSGTTSEFQPTQTRVHKTSIAVWI